MRAEETTEHIEDAAEGGKKGKLTALYIAVLAVLLALGALGGNNATKETINANIAASNLYSFFQAKNIRQMQMRVTADHLSHLALWPGLPADLKVQIEKHIKDLKAAAARYESEPSTGEGKRELIARAKVQEKIRDIAQARDPYFDYSQALLQIAVVLASASLVAGSLLLLRVSYVLSGFGLLFLINAFTLTVRIGFLEG